MAFCGNLIKLTKAKIKETINTAFSEKFLFCTNVTISVSLSGVGDILEQHYEMLKDNNLQKWNKTRTLHMSTSGFSIGVICHYWYKYLDRKLPGYTIGTVIKKVIIDQFVCSPLCISAFFLTLGFLEQTPKNELLNEIKRKAWKLYVAEWVIWPPAQFINFYFLPTRYRVLYDNAVSLGYDIYTSHIKYSSEKTKSNI